MKNFSLTELVARVTTYSINNSRERDCWEKAAAITGVLKWGDSEAVESVRGWIDRAVETQNSEGNLNYADPLDLPSGHVSAFTPTAPLSSSLGYPLLRFYE